MTEQRKPILCLDFDGVIHSYTSGWEGSQIVADPPVEGAFDFIKAALPHFRVAIYSSRSGQRGGVDAMKLWLLEWVLTKRKTAEDISWINEIEWPTSKPPALVTLDDRAITFDGVWPDLHALKSFKPWNKQ